MIMMIMEENTFLKMAEDANNYYCCFAIIIKFSKSMRFVIIYYNFWQKKTLSAWHQSYKYE